MLNNVFIELRGFENLHILFFVLRFVACRIVSKINYTSKFILKDRILQSKNCVKISAFGYFLLYCAVRIHNFRTYVRPPNVKSRCWGYILQKWKQVKMSNIPHLLRIRISHFRKWHLFWGFIIKEETCLMRKDFTVMSGLSFCYV